MKPAELWADTPHPPWTRLPRTLRPDLAVSRWLRDQLAADPGTAGRLTGLRDFRPSAASGSTWFTGTWEADGGRLDGASRGSGVLVKVNMTEQELFWMPATATGAADLVPRVYASGSSLGETDIGWMVMEHLPLSRDPAWGPAGYTALLKTAARFQMFAAEVTTSLVHDDGPDLIHVLSRTDLCPEAPAVLDRLDHDWAWVAEVAPPEVMFGDLHFGNAAFRRPPPRSPALLFDPIPARQPWPFEPAYFEVLTGGSGLVQEMAAIRAAQGRPTPDAETVGRLAVLYCGWMALLWWGILPQLRESASWRERLARYVTAAATASRR